MKDHLVELAAEFLVQSRLEGGATASPPNELVPETELDGYAIQAVVHQILQKAGYGRLIGHKIGCTSKVMQKFLNIDYPCAGEIFNTTVFEKTTILPLSKFHRVGIECEIAARLKTDMMGALGPYTIESAKDAVGALMGAIELVDDRYENYSNLSAPTLIADDFFNAGAVIGEENPDWRSLDLKTIVGTLFIDKQEHSSGVGADILGDPMEALAWLANHRAGLGKPIRNGDLVLLGSVTQTVFIEEPAFIEVELDGLSKASIELK